MTAHEPRPGGAPPNPATNETGATVHSHDADALDAWLESIGASSGRYAALNGHRPGESTADTSPLVATAREFHTRIEDAERGHGPTVPEAGIWERIMSDYLTPQPIAPPAGHAVVAPGVPEPATAPNDPASPDVVANDTPPKRSAIVDVLTGTHPAISILLAAAVVLAILAVFRSFGDTGNAPVTPIGTSFDARSDRSGSNVVIPASGSGFGSSAQGAGTPASSGDCRFEELGSGDGSRPLTDYAPTGTIADPATLDQVNAAFADAVGCSDGDVTLAQYVGPNPDTSDNLVRFIQNNWSIDHDGFARSTLDVDTRNRLKADDTTVWIIDPVTVVTLPDGRIGAIAYKKDLMSFGIGRDLVLFATVVIFAPSPTVEPEGLVLDEIFQLCTPNGETFHCDAATLTGSHESTPVAGSVDVTPVRVVQVPAPATPVASPEAESSRWLTYPDSSDCASGGVPANQGWRGYAPLGGLLPFSPAKPNDQDAAAEVYFQVQACDDLANVAEPETTGANGLMTVDTSSFNSPLLSAEIAFGGGRPEEPVSPELLRYVTELSAALPDQDPMSYIIEGERLPASYSTGGSMSQSHRVLLPEDVVRLADGRIGGPARISYQTNNPGGAAANLANQPFIETGFVIFTVEDGRWVLDELLTICIGDCAPYWQSFGNQGGLEAPATPPAQVVQAPTPTTRPAAPVASPRADAGSGQAEGTAPVELASLGASGSVILQVSSEFTEYPLDGGDALSLPVEPSGSVFRTLTPNVVGIIDIRGEYLMNLETGSTSETLPAAPRTDSVWVLGPYRVTSYTDPADILVADLRTLEIRSLSGMIGAGITEQDPEFHVQGDQNGNLIVGVTSVVPSRADVGVAAFISGSLDNVRQLDGWIAGGSQVNPGAVSPDGSSVAYTVATGESRTLRIESADGITITRYQPPAGGAIEGFAFEDDTHLILFVGGEIRRLTLGEPAGENEPLGSYPGHLSAFSMNPDGTSLVLSSRFGEDPRSANQWSLLDLHTGELSALPELDGGQLAGNPDDSTATRFVRVDFDPAPDAATPDLSPIHRHAIFDHQTRAVACRGETGRWLTGSPDQSLLVGPGPGSEYLSDSPSDLSPRAWHADGSLVVLDAVSGETRLIPFPDVGTEPGELLVAISPDNQYLAVTIQIDTGPFRPQQTWMTRTDGSTGWALVGAGGLVSWLP